MGSILINNLQKSGFNIFEQWKKVQKDVLVAKAIQLKEKKQFVWKYQNEYTSILSSIKKDGDGYQFNLPSFVRVIRYLNSSNGFFNNRISSDSMDEYLILIYLYEWLYLGKDKDESVLGKKIDVIKKLKLIVKKTGSNNKKLFENLDLDDENAVQIFTSRLNDGVIKTFNQVLNLISLDMNYFSKIKLDNFDDVKINDEYLKQLWIDTFSIVEDNITYSYSAMNSDDNFIYINVETKNEQIAFVKFRMFETFTYKSGNVVPSGIGKELLRIEFLNKHAESIHAKILTNSLKIANRVVKHIFLIDVKNKIEETGNKKVVNITPMKKP